METKIWDCSFTKEDIEVFRGEALTDGEWEIVVDELYNNDELHELVSKAVARIANKALE